MGVLHRKNEYGEPENEVWPLSAGRVDVEFLKQTVDEYYFCIRTSRGEIRVREGDWVVTGIQGEKYPCEAEIFEALYEGRTEYRVGEEGF